MPTLAQELDIPQAATIWPASAFALATGSSLLIFGRLADIYGAYIVYVLGLAWYLVWSIIAGFSQNELMMDFSRALQGFGPAAFLSAGIGLLGSAYPPGPRKNMVFSIFGAMAPLGFFVGIFFSGLAGQLLDWRWYFWIGAILITLPLITGILTIPTDFRQRSSTDLKMDWLGTFTIVPGLALFTFAITDSAHAPNGWRTSYVYVTFILGCLFLAAGVYVEGWVAEQPLLPSSTFKFPYMKGLIASLFFSYGVLGVWLLYSTFYMQNVMGAEPLQIVAWYVPFGLGGLILSTLGGFVLHLIPNTILLLISSAGWVVSCLLFAIAPPGANYWAYILPAMIGGTIGIDISYNITNIFITTTLPANQQGIAGAIANSALFLGISIHLGFADMTASSLESEGESKSFKAAFWYAMACSIAALVIQMLFVRIDKAKAVAVAEQITEERADDKERV